jgi:hypothetical protein
MTKSFRRFRRLFRRLVKSLPLVSGPCGMFHPDVNDLRGSRDYNDDKINLLRQANIPNLAPNSVRFLDHLFHRFRRY